MQQQQQQQQPQDPQQVSQNIWSSSNNKNYDKETR